LFFAYISLRVLHWGGLNKRPMSCECINHLITLL
jgi:hypothetical protein